MTDLKAGHLHRKSPTCKATPSVKSSNTRLNVQARVEGKHGPLGGS